jgi:hypothetical protein
VKTPGGEYGTTEKFDIEQEFAGVDFNSIRLEQGDYRL